MGQLVELNKNVNFEELGVEVIAVFREETSGVDGLQKIKDRTKVEFTLALDLNKEKTPTYSPGKGQFDNYVVDKHGVVRAVIDGTKTIRAKSDQILKELEVLKE